MVSLRAARQTARSCIPGGERALGRQALSPLARKKTRVPLRTGRHIVT